MMTLYPQRKIHDVITIGNLSPALAKNLRRFEICNAYAESGITRLSTEHPAEPFTFASQSGLEKYAWIFANHREIGSPVLADVLARATETAATFLYIYFESYVDAESQGHWLTPSTKRSAFGVLLTPYTNNDFDGLDMFLACTTPRQTAVHPDRLTRAEVRATDSRYTYAKKLVLDHETYSLSLIQRSLQISYSHAARLLDAMTEDV